MAWADFGFTPTTGLSDTTSFPTTPADETAARSQFMTVLNQIKTFLNLTVKETSTNLGTHSADTVTDSDGAHGLKIETGTFTPALKGATTAGTNTYTAQAGFYQKIGSLAHCDMIITLSAKDVAMAGNVYIDGLPFAFKNTANLMPSISIGEMENITFDAGITGLNGVGVLNTSTIIIMQLGSAKGYVRLPAANIANNTTIMVSIDYQV